MLLSLLVLLLVQIVRCTMVDRTDFTEAAVSPLEQQGSSRFQRVPSKIPRMMRWASQWERSKSGQWEEHSHLIPQGADCSGLLRKRWCWKRFETSRWCRFVGGLGYTCLDDQRTRRNAMRVATVLSVACISLQLLLFMSFSSSLLTQFNWIKGTSYSQDPLANVTHHTSYAGLVSLMRESYHRDGHIERTIAPLSPETCEQSANIEYCQRCSYACKRTCGLVVTSMLTAIPQLLNDRKRLDPYTDLNFQKNMRIFCGILGMTFMGGGMYAFWTGCGRNRPTRGDDADTLLEFEMGSCWYFLLAAMLL
eukprot:g18793.t1